MENLNEKVQHLQSDLVAHHLDAMIVSDPSAIAYYTDIEIDPMERLWLLIVFADRTPQLIANRLFVFEPLENIETIWVTDALSPIEAYQLTHLLDQPESARHIGVDKLLIARSLLPLMSALPNSQFTVSSPLVDDARGVKSLEEQEFLREASRINDIAMGRLIDEVIPYGVSELEACDALLRIYQEEGANQGFSFEPIVAYGANGADPHHVSDHTRPNLGDSVIIDIGCRHNNYCSDMTRTVYYGEPSEQAKQIYNITKQAQQAAIDTVKIGETFHNVDLAARHIIQDAGYGEQFTHRTGHFIGRDVHEYGDVSEANTKTIQLGNCFSIEPGIYLLNNTAVRIEDLVIAQANGAELINHYTRELTIITPKQKK